jgi:hypothetical protein
MFEVDKPTRNGRVRLEAVERRDYLFWWGDLGKLGNINQYLRLMRSSLSRKRKPYNSSIRETQQETAIYKKNAIMMPGKFYYHNYGVEGKNQINRRNQIIRI